jgi:hypothetical protein
MRYDAGPDWICASVGFGHLHQELDMDVTTAKKILKELGYRMHPRLRKNYESYVAGEACHHAFCIGDDQTGKLECSVCGEALGDFNPAVDKSWPDIGSIVATD